MLTGLQAFRQYPNGYRGLLVSSLNGIQGGVMSIRLLLPLLPALALQAQPPSAAEIRSAVDRALPLVQSASKQFYKTQDCHACHHLSLPMLMYHSARQHGFALDEEAAAAVATKGLAKMPDLSSFDRAVQNNMVIDTVVSDGWAVIAAIAGGVGNTPITGVYARRIANHQLTDGHFRTGDARPPQSFGDFTATATAVRAIAIAMPEQLASEKAVRLARAKQWLQTARPSTTEDYTSRLIGLTWSGATSAELVKPIGDLSALQRPNGGWAQMVHLEPDAYSTGEALVALHDAGIGPTDPRYQKGVRYLLQTRDDRGVWHVRTRMVSPAQVSPPFVETGFPYGHDQFLSMDGTCWALMALMKAVPTSTNISGPRALPAFVPRDIKPWMTTAALGTAAGLKSLLDGGLDPNSKTAEGTMLLMMAAHDPEKVKLLLARGADATAKAKSGFTALMVAAGYRGNAESMKLLLDAGAEARSGTGVMFNASPLNIAALTGDPETIALLLSKGADPNRKMNLLGMFPSSALFSAVGFGDPEVLKLLAKGGSKLDERDDEQLTALHWAVLANHADAAKTLIAAGASVNAVDKHGYTPLHYASTIDFGNAETVKALLAARADRSIKTKDGKTAAMQAAAVPYLKDALK
jgi:ankyrin repeat protein